MITSKYFFFLLFSLLITNVTANTLYAQALQGQSLIDSLLQELPKAKNDTSKAKIFYSLSGAFAPNDSATALNYASQCMDISKHAKWSKGVGLAHHAFANAYYEITEYALSLQHSSEAYDIFKNLNDKNNMARELLMMVSSYAESGYSTKAIEKGIEALRLFESTNDKQGLEKCYIHIGGCYFYNGDFDKAIENYDKALILYKESNNKYGIASVFDNIASVFINEGKYDSANIYNLQAIKIFEEINNLRELGTAYFNRGNILKKLYDAKSAYEYYMRAVEINKKLGIKMQLADDYGVIGELYLDLATDSSKKYIISPLFKTDKRSLLKKGQYYIRQTLSMSKNEGDIFLLMTYNDLASQTEEQLGNYKAALAFHKEYMLYKDSIFNDENKKKVAQLENQRLAEVKDREIKLLAKDKTLQASEIKRQRLIRNIIITGIIAAAIFSFFLIRSRNRRQKTIFDKQVLETEMKALRAQMNPHFIFNSLNSINKYMMENDKENASVYLSKFSNLMRLILENSREQEVLLEDDLHALELYMQLESLRFKKRFAYTIETDPAIDKNTLIPPLLLQPLVENSIIHGLQNKESGIIKISVQKEDNVIKCVVEDNGRGRRDVIAMEANGDDKHKSLGIKIINERLSIINRLKKAKAAVSIFDLKDAENKPKGLRVELSLPLQSAF
jgi:tetratricopeptide (TPR) repeat protein/two-component sensor histidine kinase